MNPTQGVIASRISEADLLRSVVHLAHCHGWLSYHTWNSRKSAAGFPDLVMVRSRRLIFVELKSQSGKLTAQQQVWADGLGRAEVEGSVDYYTWRPGDLISGVIEARLR
ncbi:MAG: VRR-NUC domain-containing protein [Candidatus Dormibacteria bacterium]